MKRIKLMAAAAIMAAVAIAGYMGYTAYEYATMTDQERLMLANIEALTSESGEDESTGYNWQTMARCGTGSMQWACTTVRYADYCSRYVCLVNF